MTSSFSGHNGRVASITLGGMMQDREARSTDALNQGQTASLASLGRGFDTARSGIYEGTGKGLDALGTNYWRALDTLGNQYGEAQGYYAPLSSAANAGYNLYADATGVNGADGNSRARQAFQAGPGYEWQQQQAADSAARAASAAGITASGNTLAAINDRSSQLANQEYGNWLNRLSSWQTLAPQLAGARANLASDYGKTSAAMQYGFGQDQAGIYGNYGRSLADLGRGLGTAEAGIYGDHARSLSGLIDGYGDRIAGVVRDGFQAGENAAANRTGTIMSGLSSLSSLAGSIFGGKGK